MGGAYKTSSTGRTYDFYPTYHALTRLVLPHIHIESKDARIFEPCAGNGDISFVLKEKFDNPIFSTDIQPLNPDIEKCNFLECTGDTEYLVTNPPYNIFKAFWLTAMKMVKKEMWLLLPTDYLHGQDRFKYMYNSGQGSCLKTVYVFIRRPLFGAGYDPAGLMPTGAETFGWFHFDMSYWGYPEIKWLDNSKFMGTPTSVKKLIIRKKVGFLS